MYNYLSDRALHDVWCSPGQDKQFNIKLNRVSPISGYRDFFYADWAMIPLPKENTTYHVFNIGQYNPNLLGLIPDTRTWRSASSVMNSNSVWMTVFNEYGHRLPGHRVFYHYARNKELHIAIEEVPWMHQGFITENVYLHLYSNAFLYSERNSLGRLIKQISTTVKNRAEIITYQERTQEPVTKGRRFCYINGRYVDKINLLNTRPGDDVEVIEDASVKEIITHRITDLRTFESLRDNLTKFLLTYPNNKTTIDFSDDIDVYVYKSTNTDGSYAGYYLFKNDYRALRNITHTDYSLAVDTVTNLLRMNGIDTPIDCFIEINIRYSGLERPLVNNANRIHDLYRLDYQTRVGAMLGTKSNVDVWRADNLENSAYTTVMQLPDMHVPSDLAESMYGYFMAGKLAADSPILAGNMDGTPGTRLPYLLTNRSTIYEYDAQGLLLDGHLHVDGMIYLARNSRVKYLEALKGYGGGFSDDVYNRPETPIKTGYNFRCYKRTRNALNTTWLDWKDVTGTNQYIVDDATIKWVPDSGTQTLVRFNDSHMYYQQHITQYIGNLQFTLMERILKDGVQYYQPMEVPLGDLDIFLNGHSLVQGIDYIVNFPEVMIVSKKYLKYPLSAGQDVKIRFFGFCPNDLTLTQREEIGFVSHGLISHNHSVNLRKDRVTRIVLGGKLKTTNEVLFAEDTSGTVGLNLDNGKPYSIRNEIIPMNTLTKVDTYEALDKSLQVDRSIENYLTHYLPDASPEGPNVLPELYPLYSPFLNAIINDLNNGVIDDSTFFTHMSDDQARGFVKDYEYLLDFDPSQHDTWVSKKYATIHPHIYDYEMQVPIHHYRFLQRIVDLYLGNRVVLNHFLSIKPV